MKKLLLLGGSAQQVVAIETAKRMGLYTVLCDYLTDNPGQYHADKFFYGYPFKSASGESITANAKRSNSRAPKPLREKRKQNSSK